MPREKTFDIDKATDRAMDVFWAKGYKATSLTDLMAATGIQKGSFYNTFKSKKALFNRVLLKYGKEQGKDVFTKLEKLDSPFEAIESLLDALVDQSLADDQCKGCLMINTALDIPNHDADIVETVKTSMNRLENFLKRQIELGQSVGEIPNRKDPEIIANGLLALIIGMKVLSRGVYYGRKGLDGIKSQALELIS